MQDKNSKNLLSPIPGYCAARGPGRQGRRGCQAVSFAVQFRIFASKTAPSFFLNFEEFSCFAYLGQKLRGSFSGVGFRKGV